MAVVTGVLGERIQAWRSVHDPAEAGRIPPHTTLCYWMPTLSPAVLESQVRHAFAGGVSVQLGQVRRFESEQQTLYLEVLESGQLDSARLKLYDGQFAVLPEMREWPWHVSCVRDSRGRDLETLTAAASTLVINQEWRIDTVAYLELRGARYEPLATWRLDG